MLPRPIPGTIPSADAIYWYVSSNSRKEFRSFLWYKEPLDTPSPGPGGGFSENVTITTPSGETYYGFKFKGKDLNAWKNTLRAQAKKLSLNIAEIESECLVIEGGERVPLAGCIIKFYDK